MKNLERLSLPGLSAHLELTPYRAVPGSKAEVPPGARKGAVAVIINICHDTPVIVLTKRVDYKGVHGGQVSFPGGKHEDTDADLIETAMRETREETGIRLQRPDLVMELSGIYIPPSNFYVQPYLFITAEEMVMQTNYEVEYPILAGMDLLMKAESLQKADIRLSDGTTIMDAPCFVYGQEIIWGATAAILNELKWVINAFLKSPMGP